MSAAPLTPSDLAELRALLEKATPGPWCTHPNGTSIWQGVNWEETNNSPGLLMVSTVVRQVDDADLIAAARNKLGAVLDALEEARHERDEAYERGRLAEHERQRTCVVCECLCIPDDSVPFCIDGCHPEDEQTDAFIAETRELERRRTGAAEGEK